MQDDAQLVQRTLQGDRQAFAVLFEKYKALVASVGYANLGTSTQLEDIIQETFTRAWENLAKLRDHSKFSSWLYGIARWVSIEKKMERPVASLENRDIASVKSEKPSILDALDQLPVEYREAIVLFYFDRRSYREMAELLGVSSATINFRLTKARQLLRDSLNK
jgi:RNA polymerase sigma-70 factor (ECF subfamily)